LFTHRIRLTSTDDLDDTLAEWLADPSVPLDELAGD
jgi:hypothetical protein